MHFKAELAINLRTTYISYSYITSTSRISLLLHETEGEARGRVLITLYPTSACDITGLYPTTFDHKQILLCLITINTLSCL